MGGDRAATTEINTKDKIKKNNWQTLKKYFKLFFIYYF